ncbi:MAG TPA: glycoside hydrolase family 3 N-terminal domain-containing protein [Solirubrobacterales bacterium]|nr:glycoside hydrolase family 3 N-terminal domain-containing protein [Solirubrobacterales bacterium]
MARAGTRRPATARRRRAALFALCAVAGASFAAGVAMALGGEDARRAAVDRLSIRELAGQRIVIGLNGTRVPAGVRRMIRGGDAAGVILFADNFPSRGRGRRLVEQLRSIPRPVARRDPLLVMTDQEGGLVKRIGGAPNASAEEMGARGAAYSREQGRLTAGNLREVGVNVDLAPVLDVARPGGEIENTDRGFASTADGVADTAVPFARAMQRGGVAATAKHFPGFGAARENTDFAVERIRLSKRTLRRVDEVPFGRFADAGGDLVMLSTAIYPAFSPKPAAFSRDIATGELRARLGFRGVSVTDALGTVATRAFGGPAKAGLAAAKSGVDMLLFSDHRPAARAGRALRRRLRSRALDRARFERSVARVLRLRHRLGPDHG